MISPSVSSSEAKPAKKSFLIFALISSVTSYLPFVFRSFIMPEIYLSSFPEASYKYLSRFEDIRISIDGDIVSIKSLFLSYIPVFIKSVKMLLLFDAHISLLIGSPIFLA